MSWRAILADYLSGVTPADATEICWQGIGITFVQTEFDTPC